MADQYLSDDEIARARRLLERVDSMFTQRVVGQDDLRRALVAGLLARGHVLIESVPGLAKTTAAQTLAAAVSGTFHRIQCTPDLMPNDIIGTQIYNYATGEMTTQLGPVHANIVLLDEINRSSAKTQSAMLEAMAEGQVTVEGNRFPLPRPFHVIATSNPIEYEGTYALPEAQLDRFMVRLAVGYPVPEDEARIILDRVRRQSPDASVEPVVDGEGLRAIQAAVERIHVDPDVARYCVALARGTRDASNVSVGASPRGSQSLVLLGRALAALDGRDYVRPDDIKRIAEPVLAHRLTLTPQAWAQGVDPRSVVSSVVAATPVPPTVAAVP